MMTEDYCAILDPALLIGWSAARVWPSTDTPPANMHLHDLWNMKEIQYIKPSKNTSLSANLQPKGHVQLKVLNYDKTTKNGVRGKTKKFEARHPWEEIEIWEGSNMNFKTKTRSRRGVSDSDPARTGQALWCVLSPSIHLQSMCSHVQRDINSVH